MVYICGMVKSSRLEKASETIEFSPADFALEIRAGQAPPGAGEGGWGCAQH